MAILNGSIRPDFEQDWSDLEQQDRKEKAWLERIATTFKMQSKGDLVGEIIRFQIADGYAEYMIQKEAPLTVVHVDAFGGYSIYPETIKGLSLADARARVEQARALRDFFDERSSSHEGFYDSLEVGAIVHYHNAFGEFLRCEVVIAKEEDCERGTKMKPGQKALLPIAMIGKWRAGDLRSTSYHARKIAEKDVFQPGATMIFENPKYERGARDYGDPRDLDPRDVRQITETTTSEKIFAVAELQGIDLQTPEGLEWLKKAIDSISSNEWTKLIYNPFRDAFPDHI